MGLSKVLGYSMLALYKYWLIPSKIFHEKRQYYYDFFSQRRNESGKIRAIESFPALRMCTDWFFSAYSTTHHFGSVRHSLLWPGLQLWEPTDFCKPHFPRPHVCHYEKKNLLFQLTLLVADLFWDTYHSGVPGIMPLEFTWLPHSL